MSITYYLLLSGTVCNIKNVCSSTSPSCLTIWFTLAIPVFVVHIHLIVTVVIIVRHAKAEWKLRLLPDITQERLG